MPDARVAIVGGGPAGLSAAYHLIQLDTNQDLDITVYQLGWRLGGKGATGRDAANHHRIEEHGIHGFCKFYFNTWKMVKGVYDAVGGGNEPCLPVQTLEEAFLPSSTVYSIEAGGSCLKGQIGGMPNSPGVPWEGEPDLSKTAIVLGLFQQMLRRGRAGDPQELGNTDLYTWDAPPMMVRTADELQSIVKQTFREALKNRPDPKAEPEVLRRWMGQSLARLDTARERFELLRTQLDEPETGDYVVRALSSLDLAWSIAKGVILGKLWHPDFDLDDLDPFDYRDWLRDHGASDQTLASAGVLSVANVLFAYPDGDSTRTPELSTASWLNWMLRSVLGDGEYFYYMAVGTGETVILPLYKALKQKGVKFEFFHKLVGVESTGAAGARTLHKLIFERQTTIQGGGEYDPLVQMPSTLGDGAQWCAWPNQPNWDQLVDGNASKNAGVDFEEWAGGVQPLNASQRELTHGASSEGFDYVVWALPSSMIPHVGDVGMQEEWKETVERLPTTATQAIQLWLTKDTNDLGWPRGGLASPTERYAGASFPNPLNGLVAFDDLIRFESWPANGPKGLIYLCSQLHDWPGAQTRSEDRTRVVQAAGASLRLMGNFLTGARPELVEQSDPQAIDFDYLYDPDPAHRGEQRLAFQYVRANTRPTEAYIRAPADGVLGRRDAWSCGYANVAVAGDWMYNGFNLGSFESAVTGGKLAAFALMDGFTLDQIPGFGFLHPRARTRAEDALAANAIPMIV